LTTREGRREKGVQGGVDECQSHSDFFRVDDWSAALTNFQTQTQQDQGFIIANRKERAKKKVRDSKNNNREFEMS